VNPLVAIAIIASAVAMAVTLMLLVRRFVAPAGGFFADSDRAAGVFGVTGTGFAVLLAFVVFLAFSSYDRARDKASREAPELDGQKQRGDQVAR
jgi:presenilin-like A22 family membrane protease